MKGFIIIVFFLCKLWTIQLMAQKSIYYQQEKIIDHFTKSEVVGKHHEEGMFLTFNQQGCYDSDKNGCDVGNGFREEVSKTEKTILYIGDSFWGNGATYKVAQDKSRINIIVGNKIYVYVRSIAPVGVNTCKLIKRIPMSNPNTVFPSTSVPNDINNNVNVRSSSEYQIRYNQMEQQLIGDIKIFEQTMSGSYNSARSQMAMAIRQAQQNMRSWRNVARQNGINIVKSPWEDVQVQIGTVHYQEKY